MSQATAADLAGRARAIAADAAWEQWSALNPFAVSGAEGRPHTVIDPEALVLASLALVGHERRLLDMAGWWGEVGAGIMSVHRARTVARQMPQAQGSGLGAFASIALAAGDRRWKALADPASVDRPRAGKGPARPDLSAPGALLLRLRAALGPGARADTLAFVLCRQGGWPGVGEIARAAGFSVPNVRGAARELVLAGLLEEGDGGPARFGTRPGFSASFVRLLYGGGEAGVPSWGHWSQVYAFLLAVASWDAPGSRVSGGYVTSSAARSLVEEHRWVFRANGIDTPDPTRYPGEAYLDAFTETLDRVEAWCRGSS